MGKGRAGARAQINGGARHAGKFLVAGNEIGVQVSLNHVSDAKPVFDGVFDVDAHVTLRVDDGGDSAGPDHI